MDTTQDAVRRETADYIALYWQEIAAGRPTDPAATTRDLASDYMCDRLDDWLGDLTASDPDLLATLARTGHGTTPIGRARDAMTTMLGQLWPHTPADDPDRP